MITEFDIDGAYASYCDKSGFVRLDGRFEADDLRYILAVMDSSKKDTQQSPTQQSLEDDVVKAWDKAVVNAYCESKCSPRPNAIPLNDQSWIVPGPKGPEPTYRPTQDQLHLAMNILNTTSAGDVLVDAARDVLLRALNAKP